MNATPSAAIVDPAPGDKTPLLDVKDLSIAFGGLKAVQNFCLSLPSHSLYGLIGPNGAGKTTAFNLLTGVYAPNSGSLKLSGEELSGKKPHQITRAGIARTFQNIRLFGQMSVLENVCLGTQLRGKHGLPTTLLRTSGHLAQEACQRGRALELLKIFGLEDRADEPASSLSYGKQRELEICRALGTNPKVLLLDEPAAGMNSQEKQQLGERVQEIGQRFQVSILLIDHDMALVMKICQRITVLDHGEMIAEGTPAEIQNDPAVIAAYLGEEPPSLSASSLRVQK